MPTSLPRRFPEVRFPAEFTALYDNSFGWAPDFLSGSGASKGGARPGAAGMNPPVGVAWPPRDGLASAQDIWHKQKQEDAVRMVRGSIQARQSSRIAHTTGWNQSLAHAEMEGGCGECGMAGGSFSNEGAQVLAGRGRRMLLGGVMRTLAGRQHVASRLSKRVEEFNNRDAETFETPFTTGAVPPKEQPTESAQVVVKLGEHLTALSDAMTSGVWDKDTTKEARGILSTLLSIGWAIPQNSLTMTLRQIETALAEIVRTIGAPYPGNAANTMLAQKEKGILRLVYTILERAKSVIEDLAQNSSLSPQERKMRLQALDSQLGIQAEAQRLGRTRGVNRGYRAQPVVAGQNQQIFPGGAPPGWQRVPGVLNAPPLPPGIDARDLALFS